VPILREAGQYPDREGWEMKLQFTAEDFKAVADMWANTEFDDYRNCSAEIAEAANARLAEMLAAAPVVYGNPDVDVWESDPTDAGHTHRARLVDVEELPR
jgi:hypothetical protein